VSRARCAHILSQRPCPRRFAPGATPRCGLAGRADTRATARPPDPGAATRRPRQPAGKPAYSRVGSGACVGLATLPAYSWAPSGRRAAGATVTRTCLRTAGLAQRLLSRGQRKNQRTCWGTISDPQATWDPEYLRVPPNVPGGGPDVAEAGLRCGGLARRWQRGIRWCGAEALVVAPGAVAALSQQRAITTPLTLRTSEVSLPRWWFGWGGSWIGVWWSGAEVAAPGAAQCQTGTQNARDGSVTCPVVA